MANTGEPSHSRVLRRRAKTAITYVEDAIDESGAEKAIAAQKRASRVPTVNVRKYLNTLPRSKLEDMVAALFRKSPEFRKRVKAEMSNQTSLGWDTDYRNDAVEMGSLGVFPAEVMLMILQFLPFKSRKTVTTSVCKYLNQYCWNGSLWKKIDTTEISYNALAEIVIPQLGRRNTQKPGCIRELVLSYKLHYLPKADRLLNLCARLHELRSLTLVTESAGLTHKRLNALRKLVSDNESFQKVTTFTIDTKSLPLPYNFQWDAVVDICTQWSALSSFALKSHGVYYRGPRMTLAQVQKLAIRNSLLTPGIHPGHNYMTTLSLKGDQPIDSEILLTLGSLFPEIEIAAFNFFDNPQRLNDFAANSSQWYSLMSRCPRLRKLEVYLTSATSKEHSQAVSATFFSVIHNCPALKQMCFKIAKDTPADANNNNNNSNNSVELFCAVPNWHGRWDGIRNKSLEILELCNWGLEWDLLTCEGRKFELPNLKTVNATDCLNLRTDDFVALLQNGGNYRYDQGAREPGTSVAGERASSMRS